MIYLEVSSQEQFDDAVVAAEPNQVIVITGSRENIAAYNVKNTIEVRDGILIAIKCHLVVALNDAKVLAHSSTVYANDNSIILNAANSRCLLYDSAQQL